MIHINKEILHFLNKSLTLKRIFNAFQSIFSYLSSIILKKPIIRGYPPIVMIEPTNICNLKCPLCPSGNGSLKREKGFMDFNLFKKIIDEIADKSLMVILWNQGESFLNQDFLKMCKYASQKGLYTLVSTNANIELDAEKIVRAGIDTLIFSIDGLTQATYNKYRVNGNLDKVIENLKALIEVKDQYRLKLPLIEWQFLVMKHNEHEVKKVKKFAKKIGVDSLKFKSVQIYSKEDIKFLPESNKYRRYKINNNDFSLNIELKNRCRRLWQQPVVNWNGEVAVCCFDKDNEIKMGNIKNKSLGEIWCSQKFNKFRKKILNNRAQVKMCRNCGEGVKLKYEK